MCVNKLRTAALRKACLYLRDANAVNTLQRGAKGEYRGHRGLAGHLRVASVRLDESSFMRIPQLETAVLTCARVL